ncbi:MAG: hypothetical protein WCX71_03735 [Candidatus Buchananbacteria bacterium]
MATVLLVEDKERYRVLVIGYLVKLGHTVIEASTIQQALELVEQLDSLGINIAVLDGNLSSGDYSGKDGKKIAEAIKAKNPAVKTIAWSGFAYTWGDAFVPKNIFTEEEMNTLAQEIQRLLAEI